MSQEKTCKQCSNQFVGFTPICKACTLAKRESTGESPNTMAGLEYKSPTGFVSPREPRSTSTALNTGNQDELQGTLPSKADHMPLVMDSRRKTKLCKNFPNCRYADEDCHFLHPEELKTPFAHLRKVCVEFKREGKCKYGSRCHYAHTLDHIVSHDTSVDSHKTTNALPSFGVMRQPAPVGSET